jgi:hypothetical protein
MRGQVVLGAVSLASAGGNAQTRHAVLLVIGAGSFLLVPSLVFLYRLFRREAGLGR